MSAIFANLETLKIISRYLTRESTSGMQIPVFLVLILLLASVGAGLGIWEHFRKRPIGKGSTPEELFDDLCRLHELSRQQRALATSAVAHLPREHSSLVFTDPNILANLAANASPQQGEYSRLLVRLFGGKGWK